MELLPISNWSGPGRLFRHETSGSRAPILLTHGTFSTAQTCAPLAGFLAANGHPVFVIEWRGRDGRPGRFDFHDLAEGEIAQALQHLGDHKELHLMAHSGGGLAMVLAAADPTLRTRIRSLTFLATQATHLTEAAPHAYWGIRALDVLGRIRGHWPARLLRLGPANESAALLHQWVRFNRKRMLWDRAGNDLLPVLASLNLPVMAIAGAADTVIARAEGCRALAEAFGSKAQFHLCTAATDGEDFTHSRLFKSRAAERNVWPRIAAFLSGLEDRGSRVSPAPPNA